MGKLRALHKMGVRMLTLTWNYPNEPEKIFFSAVESFCDIFFWFIADFLKAQKYFQKHKWVDREYP